ncbi:MAG: hypothetical protein K2M07_02615 [Muribaculaceae bacterium]|nr:hypothetical protein [Muribaculaceae bacterium]
MKQIEVNVGKTKVVATYKPLFRHAVEVELVAPYEGLKLEFAKDDEECNLFVDEQAEEFVKESLILIIRQIENVIRYRSVYTELNDEYNKITNIMWTVLNEMEIPSRDKFRYHCELQDRVREEIFKQLRTMIPEINEKNQDEFLIHPYQLSKLLSVI